MIRAALIRLLWRSVADQDECDLKECEEDRLDICDAMKALGYGEHFDVQIFQQRAHAERQPCEFCKELALRIRCQGCYRDLCERCLARPNCDHAMNGVHLEARA